MFQITVKNFSTVVSDADLAKALPAFQKQVSFDFAPNWGADAHLNLRDKGAAAPSEWLLGVYDDADQAGALGYHDVTSEGLPLGKVFAKTTMGDGGLWTVTFSHELLEMLADPWVNLTAMNAEGNALYAYEVCDAVEADGLGYQIGSFQVSDFVLPDWFEPSATAAGARSFRGNVKKAFELAKGGYVGYLDLMNLSAGWQQVFAPLDQTPSLREENLRLAYRSRGHVGSRRERRQVPASRRVRSSAP